MRKKLSALAAIGLVFVLASSLFITACGKGPSLVGIGITDPPAKTVYTEGDQFSAAGMTVFAYYSDGTSEKVDDITVGTTRALVTTDKSVNISYGGFVASQSITVNAKRTVMGVGITTAPTKTVYLVGETFNKAGMVVTAYYSDGTSAAVTDYTVDKTAALTKADAKVTVTFGGKTAVQTIAVNDATALVSIAVTTAPTKTTYYLTEVFDKAGMEVTAYYTDNTSAVVTGYTVDKTGALTAADKEVTVTFNGKNAKQSITVNPVLNPARNLFPAPGFDGILTGSDTSVTLSGTARSGISGTNSPNASSMVAKHTPGQIVKDGDNNILRIKPGNDAAGVGDKRNVGNARAAVDFTQTGNGLYSLAFDVRAGAGFEGSQLAVQFTDTTSALYYPNRNYYGVNENFIENLQKYIANPSYDFAGDIESYRSASITKANDWYKIKFNFMVYDAASIKLMMIFYTTFGLTDNDWVEFDNFDIRKIDESAMISVNKVKDTFRSGTLGNIVNGLTTVPFVFNLKGQTLTSVTLKNDLKAGVTRNKKTLEIGTGLDCTFAAASGTLTFLNPYLNSLKSGIYEFTVKAGTLEYDICIEVQPKYTTGGFTKGEWSSEYVGAPSGSEVESVKTWADPAAKTIRIPYHYYTPEGYNENREEGYPVLVFLHGVESTYTATSENTNIRNEVSATTDVYNAIIGNPKFYKEVFIFAPTIPSGTSWYQKDNNQAMRDALRDFVKQHNIDPQRIYLTGLSWGGYGSWQTLFNEPDLFAAAMPVSGGMRNNYPLTEEMLRRSYLGLPELTAAEIKVYEDNFDAALKNSKTPIFAIHSQFDHIVPYARDISVGATSISGGGGTKPIIDRINDPGKMGLASVFQQVTSFSVNENYYEQLYTAGKRIFYMEIGVESKYRGSVITHNAWEFAYNDEAIFEWLFSFVNPVTPDLTISSPVWSAVPR